jgi:hypothetical protein
MPPEPCSLLPPVRRATRSPWSIAAIAGLVAVVLAVAAGPAPAAAPSSSSHLSADGWSTLEALAAMHANGLDVKDPKHLHAALRRAIARCGRLPGAGPQSADIRRICKGALRFTDRLLGLQRCGDGPGRCVFDALNSTDRDAARVAAASRRIAASLLPGRCQATFTRIDGQASAVDDAGGRLLDTVAAGDPAAAEPAARAWSRAASAFLGPGSALARLDRAGCRP